MINFRNAFLGKRKLARLNEPICTISLDKALFPTAPFSQQKIKMLEATYFIILSVIEYFLLRPPTLRNNEFIYYSFLVCSGLGHTLRLP